MSLIEQIKSKDIDRSSISETNLKRLVELFPNEKLDLLADFLSFKHDDLDKSVENLTRVIKFRSKRMPILKEDCITEFNKGKMYSHGYDKEGRPLLIFRVRYLDKHDRDIEEMAKMVGPE